MKPYIVFHEADVLEEVAVAQHVVVIVAVANLSQRVLDHVVVDVELVDEEVDVEEDAHCSRQYALEGGRREVNELHYCRHRYVHQRNLVDLVHCRVDARRVGRVPSPLLAKMGDYHADPAEHNQQNRNVYVVNEKTSLACPLKTPVHRVSTEQPPFRRHFLRVSYPVLNSGSDESLGPVRYFLIGRSIEEDKDGPYSDSLVEILRLNLVGKHGERGGLSAAEEQTEHS